LRIGLAEFETVMTEALARLQSYLRPDRSDDIAAFEGGIALFGAGRELIRIHEDHALSSTTAAFEFEIAELAGHHRPQSLERARSTAKDVVARGLAELREDVLGIEQAHAAARQIVALTAIRDELEHGGALLVGESRQGEQSDAA
jgi:hypothetical protein